jgi:hypothetical protein
MKIYESLENYFRKKKLESKELKKIPNNFKLDLNELDYQKYKDTEPIEEGSYTIWVFKSICKMFFWMFIFYAISDFMDYSVITTLLIRLFFPLFLFSLYFIIIGILADIVKEIYNVVKEKNHKLFFYQRLKRYKKNGK